MLVPPLPPTTRTYRPEIDGLRAVAVLAVVAFHYGVPFVSGGFTGVDVFFVISGLLITTTLIRDRAANPKVWPWLLGFYRRRILRIAPAMLAMLLLVMATGWFVLMPGDYADLGLSAAFAAFGLANIFFFDHTGYFDRAAELLPLLHMWSLGVEEQFYAAWPFVLLVVFGASARTARVAVAVVAALVAAGFAFAILQVGSDAKAAFYLPFARAWELGLGALLAFLPAISSRLWSEFASLAGLALLGWGMIVLSPADPFPGFNASYPCLGAALIIWPRRAVPMVSMVLAIAPLRVVGLVSYSLYLWHWPVFVLFRHHIGGAMPTEGETVLLALASLGLAFASWSLVEQPCRRIKASRVRVFAVGLATVLGVAVVGLALFRQAGFPGRLPPELAALSSLETMWAWPCEEHEVLGPGIPPACSFGGGVGDKTMTALVWGDSHAQHMAPYIEAAARDLAVTFALPARCIAGGDFAVMSLPYYSAACLEAQQTMVRYLQQNPKVQLVILSAAWTNLVRIPVSSSTATLAEMYPVFEARLSSLLDSIAAPGRRILVIADVPQTPMPDPVQCALAGASLWRRPCSGAIIPSAYFEALQRPTYEIIKRVVDLRPDVDGVYPGDALCRSESCLTDMDGEFLYRDKLHIRRNLSPRARRDFADLIGLTAAVKGATEAPDALTDPRAPARP